MRNIKLVIAFDGTAFHGWQIQPNDPTIQGEIEKQLATIHRRQVTLHGAGRTDAGVHAAGMVAHFHTDKSIAVEDFAKALNAMLPDDIRILSVEEAEPEFHSRFSARSKTYSYSLFNGEILLPQQRLYTLHVRKPLNLQLMQSCLEILTGSHDFGCFETAGSRDPNTPCERGSTRTIFNASISTTSPDFHRITITGDGFLRHMVRNIVGTILEVGLGRRTMEGFIRAFESKKRSEGGATAPAHALTLVKIHYRQQDDT